MSRQEDLENMSEARRIRFEQWHAGTPDPVWSPAPRRTSPAAATGSLWPLLALIALIGLAGLLPRANPSALTSGQTPAVPVDPVQVRSAPPSLGEPRTTLAPTWAPGSPSGRLFVVSEKLGPSAHLQLTRDGVSWEGYVRAGDVASIELIPGRYTLVIRPRNPKLRQGAPTLVDIQSPADKKTIRLTMPP